MRYYFAPLEGVTGYVFRNAHRKYFPGVDKYFTPFISTNQNHRFTNREMRDILPEHNAGTPVVPQLLGKVPEEFVQAAGVLEELGYREVNLNLGCPSGTVVAKGKGSGALGDLDRLARYLDCIFTGVRIPVSIKTRLGLVSADEFPAILEVFNRYPVHELTIHPRVQRDFYRGTADLDAFARALPDCRGPVCYNGDLETAADCERIERRFPQVRALMLGRGLVANPGLVTRMGGGPAPDRATLRAFHGEIYAGYRAAFRNDRNAMMRMKELWSYLIRAFADSDGYGKKLRRATTPAEFDGLIEDVFRDLPLRHWRG